MRKDAFFIEENSNKIAKFEIALTRIESYILHHFYLNIPISIYN